MEVNRITKFLENKNILITGVPGFLAKIYVEKILREQPKVAKLFLIIRAEDSETAEKRLQEEVINKDLFKVLKEMHGANFDAFISEKITPVLGDISCKNLGVRDNGMKEKLWEKIDVIVNIAATTRFDERYDLALSINTMGAKNVLDFAKNCTKLEMLLHVSTAYVCGERSGVIVDNPFKLGETLNGHPGLDIEQEHKIVQQKLIELQAQNATKQEQTVAMRELGMQRSRFYGWPNTYVFTKSMAEMVIGHERGNIPLCIIRPTVIIGTYKEPFPGWMEGFRTVDGFVIGYGKGKLTSLFLETDVILDLIPADMVVNAMIVASVNHANQPNEFIYQVGSSLRNPFIVCKLRDYAFDYFYKNPWINSSGNQVRVRRATLFSTAASFRAHILIRYLLPLKVLQVLNGALCNKLHHTYTNINRKIKFMLRIMELNRPYLLFKGIFDTTKVEGLRATLTNKSELNAYDFDPSIIDWESYFMSTYFPSIVKYAF